MTESAPPRRPRRGWWLAIVVLLAWFGYLGVWSWVTVQGVNSKPSGADANESAAVLRDVQASGVIPARATAGRNSNAFRRLLLIYGVEDDETQAAILRAATTARARCSTKPLEVVFYAAHVVKDGHGGAKFPGGTRELRRETIP